MTKPNHHIFADGQLRRDEDTLRIDTVDDEIQYLQIENLDAIYLHGQIDFNTRSVGLLNDHGVTMHIFGWNDVYQGSYVPKRTHISGETIVKQVRAYDTHQRRMKIARSILSAAIHNMRANTRYYNRRGYDFDATIEILTEQQEVLGDEDNINSLRGVEATARKAYYRCFDKILKDPFKLSKREYNPPTNEANALVSFLNSMVYTACVSAIRKTALDPTVGFIHEPGERRFTLSLDIADIFKPILADRIIFRVVNRQQLSTNDFESNLDGCLLTEDGRMTVLKEYEQMLDQTVDHPRLNRKVSYKTLIQTDVYSLKKHILTGEEYHATERWW